MLSKCVCTKCQNRNKLFGWDNLSDSRWRYNWVCCPADLTPRSSPKVYIQRSPPKWCPYVFEHAVAVGKDDETEE